MKKIHTDIYVISLLLLLIKMSLSQSFFFKFKHIYKKYIQLYYKITLFIRNIFDNNKHEIFHEVVFNYEICNNTNLIIASTHNYLCYSIL